MTNKGYVLLQDRENEVKHNASVVDQDCRLFLKRAGHNISEILYNRLQNISSSLGYKRNPIYVSFSLSTVSLSRHLIQRGW